MSSALALAVAIACAFSQPNCQTIQRTPIVQADTGSAILASAYRPADRTIIVSQYVTHPALLANLITHEAVNARLVPAGTPTQASETEAYREQGEEARWFDASFGRPDFGALEPSGLGPHSYQDALWQFGEAISDTPAVAPAFGGCCTLVKAG